MIENHFVETPAGDRLRYVQAGRGPDVVLVHGSLVTLEDMVLGLADRLSPHFRVTAFDRPGHGMSTRGRLQGTIAHQAESLRQAMEALDLRRPVLVGHSAGGPVVLTCGMRHPEWAAGVVALAPIVVPELRLEQMLFGPRSVPGVGDAIAYTTGPLIDAVINPVLWRSMFLPQAMPERFAAEFPFDLAGRPRQMQANGEDSMQMMSGLVAALREYPTCPVPVTIVSGDADVVVNPLHSWTLARLLPNAQHLVLRGAGHMVHHFHQDVIAEAIGDLSNADTMPEPERALLSPSQSVPEAPAALHETAPDAAIASPAL